MFVSAPRRSWVVSRRAIVCLLLVGNALGAVSVAQAEWPSYLLLRPATVPPTKKISHAKPRGIYPGDPYQVRTNAYAYGWFGATSKPKWTCHYGYYDDWRQISIRR